MRSLVDVENDELDKLNAEPWMVAQLLLNPRYVHWGPGEDYMTTKGDGWAKSIELGSWEEFGSGWELDDMNECVHFYFELDRPSERCEACGGRCYNPATREIEETFYDHDGYRIDFATGRALGSALCGSRTTGRQWRDRITQDEVDALLAQGRLGASWDPERKVYIPPSPLPTVDEVNAANSDRAKRPLASMLVHDGFNRMILVETRATRLGVFGMCAACDGMGHIYTAPNGHLNLVVWMIHPRKGASKGIRIVNLSRDDAAAARSWLRQAAERNAARFAALMEV